MATLLKSAPLPFELESRIESFERAYSRDGSADISDFLPANGSERLSVLAELIRVEIELLWSRGEKRPLSHYLKRFPQLAADTEKLSEIAFEEYRQRVQTGESVTPNDYASKFGIDVSSWDEVRSENSAPRTQCFDNQPVAAAPNVESSTGTPEINDIILRRFRIKEKLGKGAFGSVFQAERLDLFNRPVALKFLPAPSAEPAMLAQLIHENVVPIESVDRFGNQLIICMPYRGRTTLQHVVDDLPKGGISHQSTGRMFLSTLQERSAESRSKSSKLSKSIAIQHESGVVPANAPAKPLSELEKLEGLSHVDASLRIVRGVAAGLAHAHDHGIIHRDLKPANILLADDGTPMILDFNLAAQIRKDKPLDCIRMGGTFPYMAPEQIQAARDKRECLDPRSDLYSLGVVLFELLTGQHPFPKVKRLSDDFLDKLLDSRRGKLLDPCQLNFAVPRSVADILTKLLAFDPTDRYQNARELKEDIERHVVHLPLKHARESSLKARVTKFRRRRPALSAALAAGLFVILPACMTAGMSAYIAHRVTERQRAEALVLSSESLRACDEAKTLAYARHSDSQLLAISQRKAEELVDRYRIIRDDNWEKRSEVSRLSADEQTRLLNGLGETFLVISEAKAQHARDTGDDKTQSQAEHWRKLAEGVFGKSGRKPSSLGLPFGSKPSVPTTSRSLPELSKLDDADLYKLASDLLGESHHRHALTVLEELTQRNPQHFMGWYWRASCLDALGNNPLAVQAWTTCVALQPEFATCHQMLGLARFRVKDFARAEQSFAEAFRLEPKLVNALIHRALCRKYQRKFVEAEADLTDALSRDAAPIVAYLFRAEVRRAMKKPEEADADYAEGMKREPADEWSYSTRGYARLVLDPKQPAPALSDLDQALKINPRNPASLQNKIVAMERLGRMGAAVASTDQYLAYYPDMLQAHGWRGILLARQGNIAAAKREADHYLKSAPPNGTTYFQVGCLYAAMTKHDVAHRSTALKFLDAALANGYDRPELFRTDADLDSLRNDEQFRKLLAQAEDLIRRQRPDQAAK